MIKYIVETEYGDKWEYDDLEDARRATYIFGGTIKKVEVKTEDDSK